MKAKPFAKALVCCAVLVAALHQRPRLRLAFQTVSVVQRAEEVRVVRVQQRVRRDAVLARRVRDLRVGTIFADGGSHINGVSWAPELPD